MTEYTLRVPVAMCGDDIALCLVAEAMARHAATGYGTLSLHGPTLNNLLPKRVALLVDAACQGQLKVRDYNGRIKPAKEIIEAKDKLNIDSPYPESNALSLYVKKQHLIEWGNANGDVFHIVDAPAEVVQYGPKNAHGEFAVRGFVSGLDAPAAKEEAAKRSITKQQTVNAFEGLHFDRDKWNKYLGCPPNWLMECRVTPGRRGDNSTHATWNPVLIAAALFDKKIPINKLNAVFVHLPDWNDEWQETSASFTD